MRETPTAKETTASGSTVWPSNEAEGVAVEHSWVVFA